MDMRRFLDLFLAESREHLAGIESRVEQLCNKPSDGEALSALYRHAHSLKGMAASMGFREITEVAHQIEDLLDEFRERALPVGRDALDVVAAGFDGVATLLDALPASGGESGADLTRWTEPISALTARLRSGDGGTAAPPPPAAAAAPASVPASSGAVWNIVVGFVEGTPIAAARALVVLARLGSVGRLIESAPERAELERGEFSGSLGISLESSLDDGPLREMILTLPDVASVDLSRQPAPSSGPAVSGPAEEERGFDFAPAVPLASAPMPEISLPEAGETTVRVRAESLDRVLDAVGELIVQGAQLRAAVEPAGIPSAGLQIGEMERLTARLSREVLALRLVPFDSVSHRFVRAARELSRDLGRPLQMRVEGREVRLDRGILDELADPILHMIRNAVGHGIEEPAERRASGKPPEATVRIALSRRDGGVEMRIEDDGRGMDPRRIREKACERGFLTAEQAAALPDAEILMLTTLPGFSTAERITELSGRGVGMDVVRTRVETMGGRIAIESTPGSGTRITLWLPLTIAVLKAFVVQAGERRWAIPLHSVERVIRWPEEGGAVEPAGPLAELVAGRMAGSVPVSGTALVVRAAGRSWALGVDAVLAQREIVVKPLGPPLEEMLEYAGATVLEDGRIALILDPVNLLEGRVPDRLTAVAPAPVLEPVLS